jgi:signal transduction histidine kinase
MNRAVVTDRELEMLRRELEEARADASAVRDALGRAEARALEASRLKDEFLATLSHELRTPLNAVLGWVQILRLYGDDPAVRARALEVIARNAEAQTELVKDLLDVSSIVNGKLRLRLSRVDLRDVVRAGCDTILPCVEARRQQLAVEAGDAPAVVVGDSDRLQQVVWNLLSNAAKFTPPGGRIQVRLAPEDGCALLTVSDTGIGIAPEFVPHVFERFRQWDSGLARMHGGLGLGLSIVRHLVELHGGSVSAASEGPGRGATFVVRLPARG